MIKGDHSRRSISIVLCTLGLMVVGGPLARANESGVPYIDLLSPVSATVGGPQFTLTVNGTDFAVDAVVEWNGTPLTTTRVSAEQLTATVPGSDIAAAGTAAITVSYTPVCSVRGAAPETCLTTVSNVVYFPVTVSSATVAFSASTLTTGSEPYQAAVGDFNNDGIPDLAVANIGGTTVSIFVGNGDGTFTQKADLTGLNEPFGITIADFNGDGYLDIAVSNNISSGTVSVFLGNGDGTFTLSSTPQVGTYPLGTAAADFNRDGLLDLAVVNEYGNDVSILLGYGDGTFQTQTTVSVGNVPYFVSLGDFNGDGFIDMAVNNNESGTVSVLTGDGAGGFTLATTLTGLPGPLEAIPGDFNQDGILDLAVANEESSTLSIFLGNGDGTFTAGATPAAASSSFGEAVADLNGDGFLDLASANFDSASISILLGNGDGTFGTQTPFSTGGTFPAFPAIADFNGDGRLDLAVPNGDSGNVSIMLQVPVVVFSPTSLNFGNQPVGATSAVMSVTLTNDGPESLNISAIAITGTDSSDFALASGGTCVVGSLGLGASCTINVTFSPTTSGNRTASVSVTDSGGGSPQTVPLSGTGTLPLAGLAPSSLSFGNQAVNTTSAAMTATLSNTGGGALTITAIGVTGNFALASGGTCAVGSLAASATCTVNVTFTPTSAGAKTGVLTITDNSNGVSGSTQTTSLSGTGTVSVAGLAPSSLSFGNQAVNTTSAAMTATLSNTGASALTITAIGVSGNFALASGGTCAVGSLAASATCTVKVDFTPTSAGAKSGTLTVTDNSNGVSGSTQTTGLSGTGIAAVAGVSPSSLTFASQTVNTTSAAQSVTLSNTGASALTVTSVAISGTNSGDFGETNTCGTSVAASASCAISVTFKPTASGARTATLTVTDNSNGASGSTQTVSLTGTGSSMPVAGVAPSTLTFASQSVGTTSSAQSVTLTNSGTAVLILTGIALSGTDSGDFGETNTCGTSVAASASCTISITFKPTAAGTRAASLVVTDNSNNTSGSTQTVILTGTGAAEPVVSLSPTSLTFSSSSASSGATVSTAGQTVTLTNTGNGALTVTSITATGPFAATNTCGTSVAAGANCAIIVTFKPTEAGTETGSVTITDNAAASPQTVTLTGTTPYVTLSTSSVTLPGAPVGISTNSETVTVTNTNSTSLAISSITVSPSTFTETNTCGSSLAAGASCAVTITFTASTDGVTAGKLYIVDNAPSGPQVVPLTGIGQDFSLGPYDLTKTVSPGASTSYDLRLAPVEGFSQPIQLTCSGAPTGSTCTVTPSSVTLNPAEDHSTILMQVTTAQSSQVVRPPAGPVAGPPRLKPMPALWMLVVLLGILLMVARPGSQRVRHLVPLMLLLGSLLTWAACGSSSVTQTTSGTPAGTYTLTVTATSGKITHSVMAQLIVN